ncbi:MAG: hypothetical protein HYV09_21505 [Deltaproteobacteria bacterium]|nr:hypothetical protein [Deltaproteobacteria bacterium]
MRFLALVVPLSLLACRSDAPGQAPPAPVAAASAAASSSASAAADSSARRLDTTPIPGPPAPAAIAGWWVVEAGYAGPTDDPGSRAGAAWWFSGSTLRLLVGDASDSRAITKTTVDGDALRLDVEGSDVFVTRRRGGVAVRMEDEPARIPLRPATPGETQRLEAIVKKREKMAERACEKALACCQAALAKNVAKEGDCKPLLVATDLETCIRAIDVFKRKAATANVIVKECLPDR